MGSLEGVCVTSASMLIYRENQSFTFYLSNDDLLAAEDEAAEEDARRPGGDEVEHLLVAVLRDVDQHLHGDEQALEDEHAELQERLVAHVDHHHLHADVA